MNQKTPPPQEADKSDLEVFLRIKLPELARKYADRALLFLSLIILTVAVFYYRSRSKDAERVFVEDSAATAWQILQSGKAVFNSPDASESSVVQRLQRLADIELRVNEVLSRESTPQQKAMALMTRAELYWSLSNLPSVALATTQPSAGLATTRPASDYRSDAEADYRRILADYPDLRDPVMNSLFSLATIEEDRRDFDKAAERYNQIINDKLARPIHKELAQARLKILPELKTPLLIATPVLPSPPATMPAALPESPTGDLIGLPGLDRPQVIEPDLPASIIPSTQPASPADTTAPN